MTDTIDNSVTLRSHSVAETDVVYTAPRTSIRCVRDSMRIIRGDASSTPSPFFARAERLGLLFTLNRKQALICQRLESEQTSLEEVPELAKLVQFLGFVTSGVVAETERVDEALLQTQEEAIRVGREIKILDTKLQSLKRTPQASLAERAIAERFPSRIVIRQSQAKRATVSSTDIPENLKTEAEGLAQQINENRAHLAALGDRIRVLTSLQTLMHGTHRLNGTMSNAEIITLVDEISLSSALRRAVHLIRDLAQSSSRVTQEEFEEMEALKILREFLQFVEAGISAILDDLFRAQLRLKKAAAIEDITFETQKLHEQNERNKMEKQIAIENVANTLDATMFSTWRYGSGGAGGSGKIGSQRQLQQQHEFVAAAAATEGGENEQGVGREQQQQQQDVIILPRARTSAPPPSLPLGPTRKKQPQQSQPHQRVSKDRELESFLAEYCA